MPKKPNKKSEAAKKGWATRKEKREVASIVNEMKGRGNEISDSLLSEGLLDKKRFLERQGLNVDAKMSHDGTLIYLATEVGPTGEGLELAAAGPSGFLYRVSAIYETKLTLTKEYKLVMKGGAFTRKVRAMGTMKEEQMQEIRLEKPRALEDKANKIFGKDTTRFVAVSVLIMEPRSKK